MRRGMALIGCLLLGLISVAAGTAWAVIPAPAWQLTVSAVPSNLEASAPAGSQGFYLVATNVGSVDTEGEFTLADHLPVELSSVPPGCQVVGQLVSCSFEKAIPPGRRISIFLPVTVDPDADGSTIENVATLEGGGAATVEASVATQVGNPPPSFGFLPGASGLDVLLSGSNGISSARAGSTPYQLTIGMGFPTGFSNGEVAGTGHPRDLSVDLPPGLVFDPGATPRCREADLASRACPPSSQVGSISVGTLTASVNLQGGALYNMVPPPGSASSLGFEVGGLGIRDHLLGSLRPGDYRLSAAAEDLLAKYPIISLQLQLWGYPADPAHDAARGSSVESQARPFITMPNACGPLELAAQVDSWENPAFAAGFAQVRGLGGSPVQVEGCSELKFEPSLSVQPTSPTADDASGLDLTVVVPQHRGPTGSTTADLRDAKVTLPPGAVINPAAAGGLASCTPAQIGLLTQAGQRDASFDDDPAACPDASKLGTIEVSTSLLEEESEQGARSSSALTGSIYLAQPDQNPFGSTFALYAAIEDPERGIVVKLPGEVTTDPSTGQLTATFDAIPQLPFEEFKLEFFGGPQGILRVPARCGDAVSRAEFTSWSGGTGPTLRESPFAVSSRPGGGPCTADLPNAPRFVAGTVSPAAGRHSPFVLRLSRGDGTQEMSALNVTLPVGLVGRLANSTFCPDAALASAEGASGAAAKASSPCPTSSLIGRLVAEVGAGSSPYEMEGKVFLAGAYKGAPLSLVAVTPAIAGPFDLGTVVVRAAVFVDSTTGQLTVKSDSLPTMLDGVPLDVRSVQLELDKPDLIRNPTSCDPMAITGSATTTLGQVAALSSSFQVGDCATLSFKPKLSLGLSGAIGRSGHPALRAVLRTDPEGAALKSASFSLPDGELLDLKHVRALCPREVAVGSCPSASRLGSARISSPSLEAPLEGPVYLRVPSHRLPDLIAEVRSEGLSFLLRGRATDSRGRLGVKLESLPDIPLSKAILSLAGGRRGILVNSHSLCGKRGYSEASLSAHNGRVRRLRVPIGGGGCR